MSDWKYEINDGLVAFYEDGIERNIDKVFDTLNAAEARIAELSQAVGLITTLKPTMVMDANHPLDMVREVAEHVTTRIAELEGFIDRLIEEGDALESQAYVAWRKYGMLDFPAAETWCALVKDWKEREE